MNRRAVLLGVSAVAVLAVACSSGSTARTAAPSASSSESTPASVTPTPSGAAGAGASGHVVVVVMENKPASAILGNPDAPYLNTLARQGTSYTAMYAIRHPSQPNYIALFSGSTHGVTDDSCTHQVTGPTLAGQLQQAGLSFAGYAEGLPRQGSTTCTAGAYVHKHAPWTNFSKLPKSTSQPFSAFPRDYSALPTVAWVIPDLDHDMHDGSVAQADTWTRQNLGGYVAWARTHHSVLVVTWDEDDHSEANRIPTFVVGAGVSARTIGVKVTLYSLLRAVEDRYGLPRLGAAASAPAMSLD